MPRNNPVRHQDNGQTLNLWQLIGGIMDRSHRAHCKLILLLEQCSLGCLNRASGTIITPVIFTTKEDDYWKEKNPFFLNHQIIMKKLFLSWNQRIDKNFPVTQIQSHETVPSYEFRMEAVSCSPFQFFTTRKSFTFESRKTRFPYSWYLRPTHLNVIILLKILIHICPRNINMSFYVERKCILALFTNNSFR